MIFISTGLAKACIVWISPEITNEIWVAGDVLLARFGSVPVVVVDGFAKIKIKIFCVVEIVVINMVIAGRE